MPPAPFDASSPRHPRQGSSDLDSPRRPFNARPDDVTAGCELLERLCNTIVADAEIETAEIMEKENFRLMIEQVARSAIAEYERTQNGFHDFPPESVQLKCFGSLASGFATKASDMDLGILSPLSAIPPDAPSSPIPRLVEKAFLDIGLGARLLTQTRVPIIKVCEKPLEELRLALVAERTKWEKGVTDEPQDDEVHETPDVHAADDVDTQADAQLEAQSEAQPEGPSTEETVTREQRLQKLKQSETSDLSGYYGLAKRVLRKLGGRDITHSNIAEFKVEDAKLLNQVGLAFVEGLADSKLRDRLLRYRSFNRYELLSHDNHLRTLLGVFTQVEGEHMAMMWESRPFQEKDQAREAAAESAVTSWRAVQDKPEFGRDPLFYQKELQLAVEQLKKVSSIQVLLLSQAQNESAANYCARALRLLHELGGHDSRARADAILPTLIQHYIGGISNQTIREQVQDFQQAHRVNNLRAIGRRHKSLQLAHEYEACLKKGLYADETAAKVRQYVELLQAPIPKSPSTGHSNGMIPLPPDAASLLSEIRLLGDPSRAAPNQPRDRYSSALEFPKSGVGVQCDINFSAHLAVQNTLLLRCYSHCDPRVRPLILFVKHWAKVRRINSAYRGTLGSYGYVLMMLHYLVNVAQPFVCPNLQQLARAPEPNLTPQQIEETVRCKGRNIQFWRDEAEIMRLARDNALTQNRDSVGQLLRGFFEYYAKGGGPMSNLPCRTFDWGRDVLSLRTHGGLLSKQAKGWTGAKTVVEVKAAAAPLHTTPTPHRPDAATPATSEPAQAQPQSQSQPQPQQSTAVESKKSATLPLRHRDPFELDHNVVARHARRDRQHPRRVSARVAHHPWRGARTRRRRSPATTKQTATGNRDRDRVRVRVKDMGRIGARRPVAGAGSRRICWRMWAGAEEVREREQFAKLLEELHGVSIQQDGEEGGAGAE
ncbi:hypothetical protein NEMBOFW57_007495 [Staphylotrichum longicolle]|uniref:polynucleotide adenylyltransferase n=1 Tax=Staphylotrichum longicolle TaxID=669026 RepID=A0AAD4EVL1_9PEZI|nr:hypothetical protein NEMBOFW57_007495 [Staphylotrichum longicolle]